MARVMILCEYPTLLGAERSMLATVDRVSASGFEILVAGPPAGALADALRQAGIEHVPWRVRHGRKERRPLSALRDDLDRLIEARCPDLVHANSLSTARISGPVVARRRIASAGHLRDIVKLNRQSVVDINSHRRLIAVSQATRNFHVAQGIEASRCKVIYNGVDLREFCPRLRNAYLHEELGLPRKARLVATVGQIGLRKATDVALEAASQWVGEVDDVHWLIVGTRTSEKEESREFEARLRQQAAEVPLRGRVHFLGTRDDMPRLMNECDLLVHTARQEPLGRVLLEAAASGLPVVATDVGGTREIFPTDQDGALLVRVDDAPSVSQGVVTLLRDDSLRAEFRRRIRRRAEQAFDAEQAAADLVGVYRQTLRQ